MKKLSAFVKTSIVGGALVLVPLLILYMLISELVELIIALVFPILELLPHLPGIGIVLMSDALSATLIITI